jgi:hypothetical protein
MMKFLGEGELTTQSRLKSATRASRVPTCVAVLSRLSIQTRKKWYGTIDSIFASAMLLEFSQ